MKENYPSKLLENAVEAIRTLPGVGKNSALRLAMHILKQPAENIHHLTSAINSLRDEVRYCRECMMIADGDICSVCSDPKRDHRTICVVENVRDVISIEKTGQYNGVYHVLGGVISPIDGIGPSDISIMELVDRVGRIVSQPDDEETLSSSVQSVPEVIFALRGDVEGETTSFYIYRQIANFGIRVSSLARGLGFGDNLEYADELTLGRSIVNRQIFRP